MAWILQCVFVVFVSSFSLLLFLWCVATIPLNTVDTHSMCLSALFEMLLTAMSRWNWMNKQMKRYRIVVEWCFKSMNFNLHLICLCANKFVLFHTHTYIFEWNFEQFFQKKKNCAHQERNRVACLVNLLEFRLHLNIDAHMHTRSQILMR